MFSASQLACLPSFSARMLVVVLVCSLLMAATGQRVEDDWIDPYDMLNYDASTKTMRKPAEPTNYPNVPTKRREYVQESSQPTQCDRRVVDLQRQIEEQKKNIKLLSQQPTCNPVFKRFLSRLLKEMQRIGLPSDSTDIIYDAKIKMSKQTMTEIETLLQGEDNWRTGALDNAISQILVNLKPHDYEAWKWRFEDTFGVELDTLLKLAFCVLIIVGIICTQLWSTVSWFIQFRRVFAVCFFVSVIWNWFYLYKIAFAEHQNNMAKMDGINEKCTGMKRIDWSDSLKEWFRSTWTLQDDPCKKYYEFLMVNPILLVPPTKAISVTITTFITEPLKHFGQGISEFLRALLKDLPVTLQIPVLLTIMLVFVVCMYGSVQAAFIHGIAAPFRRARRDPPALQPRRRVQEIEDRDRLAGGDSPRHRLRYHADDGRSPRMQIHQRRPREKQVVETLRTTEPPCSEDEIDAQLYLSAESDSENQPETKEVAAVTSVAANTVHSETKTDHKSESSPSQTRPLKNKKRNNGKPSKDNAASISQPVGLRPSQTDVQDSAEDRTSSVSVTQAETVGVSVEKSSSL